MPQDTGGILNLKKPVGSDDIRLQTIGIDLPYNFQKIDDAFTAHQADYAKGTMIRIILNISANSGDGVVNYVLGEEYVQSVVSSAYGIDINLKNIQNDAKVSSNFVITSGEGISIGGSGINPFIFQRAVSYTKLQLGIKTSPSSSHYPWNTIPSGTIRVTIAW